MEFNGICKHSYRTSVVDSVCYRDGTIVLNSSAKEDDISQVQEGNLGGLDFVRTRTGRGAQKRQLALSRLISGLSGE